MESITASPRPAPTRAGPVAPWQALVEPALVFAHPSEVLDAPHLSPEQKRAALASWASDAFAVESAPGLRLCPAGGQPVRLDDVLAALRALDEEEPVGSRSTTRTAERPQGRLRRGRAPLGRIRWLQTRRGPVVS